MTIISLVSEINLPIFLSSKKLHSKKPQALLYEKRKIINDILKWAIVKQNSRSFSRFSEFSCFYVSYRNWNVLNLNIIYLVASCSNRWGGTQNLTLRANLRGATPPPVCLSMGFLRFNQSSSPLAFWYFNPK